MPNEGEVSQEKAVEQLYALIYEEMKTGADKATISRKIEEMGIDRAEAEELVDSIHHQIVAAAKSEQLSGSSITTGMLGGVLAAIAGGIAWGWLVIVTEYEIGFAAWAIGLLCGYAVVLFAKGGKGMPLQVIATFTSVLGILVGKYSVFVLVNKEDIEAEGLSYFSNEVVQSFVNNIDKLLSPYDALWILLAVVTAWSIPKGSGIKLTAGTR